MTLLEVLEDLINADSSREFLKDFVSEIGWSLDQLLNEFAYSFPEKISKKQLREKIFGIESNDTFNQRFQELIDKHNFKKKRSFTNKEVLLFLQYSQHKDSWIYFSAMTKSELSTKLGVGKNKRIELIAAYNEDCKENLDITEDKILPNKLVPFLEDLRQKSEVGKLNYHHKIDSILNYKEFDKQMKWVIGAIITFYIIKKNRHLA